MLKTRLKNKHRKNVLHSMHNIAHSH